MLYIFVAHHPSHHFVPQFLTRTALLTFATAIFPIVAQIIYFALSFYINHDWYIEGTLTTLVVPNRKNDNMLVCQLIKYVLPERLDLYSGETDDMISKLLPSCKYLAKVYTLQVLRIGQKFQICILNCTVAEPLIPTMPWNNMGAITSSSFTIRDGAGKRLCPPLLPRFSNGRHFVLSVDRSSESSYEVSGLRMQIGHLLPLKQLNRNFASGLARSISDEITRAGSPIYSQLLSLLWVITIAGCTSGPPWSHLPTPVLWLDLPPEKHTRK